MRIGAMTRLWIAGFTLLLAAPAGCATGPLADYWAWNPWRDKGEEETQYGLRPDQRMEQLRALAAEARSLSPAEKAAEARELTIRMQNEVDPLLRAQIVRTLGEMAAPESAAALQMAMKDNDPEVRIAAGRAWGTLGGGDAVSALSEIVASDTNDDVRLAAVKILGRFENSPQAVQGLAVALEDINPAIQVRAMESLGSASGQEFGRDIVAWQNYVGSGAPEERSEPNLVERSRDRF